MGAIVIAAVIATAYGTEAPRHEEPATEFSDVTAITAGHWHMCAVVSGGGASCWGRNDDGQLGDGTTQRRLSPVPVGGLRDVVGIAAGHEHSCALISDGTVRCWGVNDFGQLGDGTTTSSSIPTAVEGISDAIELDAGREHTCALLSDGSARCWGRNGFGQLGNGTTHDSSTPVTVVGLSGARAITAQKGWHTCAVVEDGGARCWGRNNIGQLGDGTFIHRETPVPVAGLSGVTAVATGGSHTCAVVAGGQVRCWGENSRSGAVPEGFGQLGDGTLVSSPTPVAVAGMSGAIDVALGNLHSCALISGGAVRCWGHNGYGQLGDGSVVHQFTPVQAAGVSDAIALTAGGDHSCVITERGRMRCWGSNLWGTIGDGTFVNRTTQVAVTVTDTRPVSMPTRVVGQRGDMSGLAAGGGHACAIVHGTVRCWGRNDLGQLGDGTAKPRPTPVTVVALSGVRALAAGGDHTCALLTGGTVRCWGYNAFGQLGDGSQTNRSTPVAVPGLTNAIALAAGNQHTCALVAGGEARCWGTNFNGQIGHPTRPNSAFWGETLVLAPQPVTGVSDAVEIAAGGDQTCVINAGGGVQCWGVAPYGGFGDGNPQFNRWRPTTVQGLSGATSIAVGKRFGGHVCATTVEGAAYCWGMNTHGQLGNGAAPALVGSRLPVAVDSVTGATVVVAGAEHTCALLADDTARCWGRNDAGQIGDGSTVDRASPVTVADLSGGIALAAGGSHTCALAAGGRAPLCWGDNELGQTGQPPGGPGVGGR